MSQDTELDAPCIAFSGLHPSSSAEMLHLCSRALQSDAEDVHSWALWFPDRKVWDDNWNPTSQLPAQLSESGRLEGGGSPDPSATRKDTNPEWISLKFNLILAQINLAPPEQKEERGCSLFIHCSFPLPCAFCSAREDIQCRVFTP